MLLTLSTTLNPATDLGYLLYKNPARAQSFELSFGQAQVFWPEASAERATVALMVEVDPIALSRSSARDDKRPLQPYVNDRPYAASSFLSVAIGEVFGSALSGNSRERPALVDQAIPLRVDLPTLPCHGGEALLRALFEPLGYTVSATRLPLDEVYAEWGGSSLYAVTLEATLRLAELLAHLTVLIPVLDDEKHYWVGEDEVEKLLRRGGDWLPGHPQRELITRRYLKHRGELTRAAMEVLSPEESADDAEKSAEIEASPEEPLSLNVERIQRVHQLLRESGAKRVLDLGCGEGKLLKRLFEDKHFDEVVGVEVSMHSLNIAERRLHLKQAPDAKKARLKLLHGSLVYRDRRLEGYDAAACVEVVEHLDPWRLRAFAGALFGSAKPGLVLLTTPNSEFNARYPSLPAGRFRHPDHRFEWTRAEFRAWAEAVAKEHGYTVSFQPIGEEDPELGPSTQMGVFQRCD